MAMLSFPLSFAAFTSMSGLFTHPLTGHASNVPVAVTSTVVPRCPPAGKSDVSVGAERRGFTAEAQRAPRRESPRGISVLCILISGHSSPRPLHLGGESVFILPHQFRD